MTDDAVSPLRRRMIEDMTIRQFGEHTKRDYVRQVREFAMFLGRSPWSAPCEVFLPEVWLLAIWRTV